MFLYVYSKQGILDEAPRSKLIYIQGGILRLVGMGMWAVKHSQAAAV